MTNYNQIVDEVEQQITAVSTTIADKNTKIFDLQKEVTGLHTQLEGLQSLKTQTTELIAEAGSKTHTFNHTFSLAGIAEATAGETTTPAPTNSFVRHEVSG